MDERWIEYGKRLAETVEGKHRIAAIAFSKRGRPIAFGVNSYTKTHPIQKRHAEEGGSEFKQYLHAEIAALVKCRESPYRLLVVRIKRDGTTGMARPCDLCEAAIRESGVKVVEYTV